MREARSRPKPMPKSTSFARCHAESYVETNAKSATLCCKILNQELCGSQCQKANYFVRCYLKLEANTEPEGIFSFKLYPYQMIFLAVSQMMLRSCFILHTPDGAFSFIPLPDSTILFTLYWWCACCLRCLKMEWALRWWFRCFYSP